MIWKKKQRRLGDFLADLVNRNSQPEPEIRFIENPPFSRKAGLWKGNGNRLNALSIDKFTLFLYYITFKLACQAFYLPLPLTKNPQFPASFKIYLLNYCWFFFYWFNFLFWCFSWRWCWCWFCRWCRSCCSNFSCLYFCFFLFAYINNFYFFGINNFFWN